MHRKRAFFQTQARIYGKISVRVKSKTPSGFDSKREAGVDFEINPRSLSRLNRRARSRSPAPFRL